MKKVFIFLLLLSSILSFSIKLGFSTQEGIWFRSKIDNFEYKIGYPVSNVSFSFGNDIFDYKILAGYIFNNDTSLVDFSLNTEINNFSFSSYLKMTFHREFVTDSSTETGRIYIGIFPKYGIENLTFGFNFEFSWLYIYYDPGIKAAFLSVINPEDILRYSFSINVTYMISENLKVFLDISTKYKWISYLSIPLFSDQFVSFGVEVETYGNK
ncbi:hypothetical protein SU69_02005 [Thermosipho melanesiensis]|uniref:Outer membrane protein beta-barrel domain-containing protein n=2 Tax=Thermosipho melanesiensis TaxID=46541 RepID=A6LK02_THEM4|nr:hypothetical protein [Thermosipho melanesiensis]ABR30253.1 hypothetical protein Tmel_0384 [Thermosipho melanesiensis BI429]APT73441.1 hypothetical protein BW47_02085 [Thermosipho melanesiensis]OOC37384.1 hypothetical protein SU68_02015 [Thermosipho melanesiensis]OOC39746.1 hypothetical protein SU69_02005 [Thermosipho melanesiensis]OOC39851.1 hypothetical protein SU70_02000 [Thermosipho melanesiensis]